MKFCHELEAKWALPCGYPRQWLDGGGAIVDDSAPYGVPVIFARRESGGVAYSLHPHAGYVPLTHAAAQSMAAKMLSQGCGDSIYLDCDRTGVDWYADPLWAPLNQ